MFCKRFNGKCQLNTFCSHCRLVIFLLAVSSLLSSVFADNKVTENLDDERISLYITNSKGFPVKGAKVYGNFLIRDGNKTPPLAVSDKDGNVFLEANKIINIYGPGGGIAYVRYKQTAGIVLLARYNVNNSITSVRLKRACRVFGKIINPHSDKESKDNCRTKVCIGSLSSESFIYSSKENIYEFFLPEGGYYLKAYGCSGEAIINMFYIKPGQKKLELNIKLKPVEFNNLIGEEAISLKGIKGWFDGQEVQLEELEGKIVLLDFWGHWCGRCVLEMPKTMDLYARYKKYGFEVLGIHEGDNISGEQLQIKLDEISKNRWKGRTLNFPVIIDNEDKPIEEATKPIGPLGKVYFIKRFPSQVLIGRDGKIIRNIPYWDFDFENDLRELLNIKPL